LVTQDWNRTADLIACMAEVDSRKLYLPEGYASMFAFCVGRYHMDEGVAYRRIRAARMARRFPVIIEAIREGRLHLTAIVLLAPHLTQGSSDLLKAAEHKTRREIELLLAQRYPRPDLATRVFELTPASVQATFP
jgi:hypothetical protein